MCYPPRKKTPLLAYVEVKGKEMIFFVNVLILCLLLVKPKVYAFCTLSSQENDTMLIFIVYVYWECSNVTFKKKKIYLWDVTM